MSRRVGLQWIVVSLLAGLVCRLAGAVERTENFDKDPHWEGRNHRAVEPAPGAHVFEASCELQTHFWREICGHRTRGFADRTQKVIAENCIVVDDERP